MTILLCIGLNTISLGPIVGFVGGIVGIIAGLWALLDRYKNRHPRIKVFAPYQWTGNDSVTGKHILSVFFRISNISQTPTYLYLETLKAEIYYTELQKWESIQTIKLLTDKIATDFSEGMIKQFGINKAKYLDVFDDCIVKFSEPLCGYILFNIQNEKYSKIRGEILDSRHKKITFEVDFENQKKYDPYLKKS